MRVILQLTRRVNEDGKRALAHASGYLPVTAII
jgi:hypothetical protein